MLNVSEELLTSVLFCVLEIEVAGDETAFRHHITHGTESYPIRTQSEALYPVKLQISIARTCTSLNPRHMLTVAELNFVPYVIMLSNSLSDNGR